LFTFLLFYFKKLTSKKVCGFRTDGAQTHLDAFKPVVHNDNSFVSEEPE
jgi:hypothetical protein